jgi:hypothetical protein
VTRIVGVIYEYVRIGTEPHIHFDTNVTYFIRALEFFACHKGVKTPFFLCRFYLPLCIFQNFLPYRSEFFGIWNVCATRFYEVSATALFVRISGYELHVIVVIRAIAHGTKIHSLAAKNLTNYIHKSLCKADYFLVYAVGRLAHIVVMLHGGEDNVAVKRETLDDLIRNDL